MSKLKIFITFSLITGYIIFASYGQAETYDRDYIINFAKTYVENNIETPSRGKTIVTPTAIDSRITIKPCSVPLSANIPENYSSRNVNVKISCDSSTPWHIFLPVKIETVIPVLVTKSKVSKGSVLNDDNMMIEWRDLYMIRGEVLEDMQSVIGARSKRSLLQGTILSNNVICVVCKGETITIVARSDDFMIKTAGVALSDATFGEQVKVKNSRSGRTITAQVEAINQVVINL